MTTWMHLKCILLSKNVTFKQLHIVWYYYVTFWAGKTTGTENRFMVARSWKWRIWLQRRNTREFWGNGTISYHDSGVEYTTLFICQKCIELYTMKSNFYYMQLKKKIIYMLKHIGSKRQTTDTWLLAKVNRKHAKIPSTFIIMRKLTTTFYESFHNFIYWINSQCCHT